MTEDEREMARELRRDRNKIITLGYLTDVLNRLAEKKGINQAEYEFAMALDACIEREVEAIGNF